MQNNTKKPAIRFAGFSDDWEQRKLGDVGKARSGVGFPDAEQGGQCGTPFFKVSDMNSDGNENEMISANNYVSDDQIARHGWKIVTEVPAVFFAKVGAAVMLNRKRLVRFPFLLDNNTMSYSLDSSKWDAEFGKALFDTIDLTSLVQIGALPSYNAGDVESMDIHLPSIAEQRKIGAYFQQLDHLITLHQRKYSKLVNTKKSMLEKMFPQNGSNVPEIRFAGFTDAWEQRKLGQISALITKGTTPKDKSGHGEINFIKVESIDDFSGKISGMSKISVDEHQGYLKRSQLQEGDILFSIAGTLGRVTSVNKGILPANTNQALSIIRLKEGNCQYVKTCLKGKVIEEFIRKNPTVGAQPNLSLEQVSSLEIGMPSEDEQEMIGNYFEQLDHLIALHQRKLERLQNIKKSCLEKMFV